MVLCSVLLVHSLTPQNYQLFDQTSERVQTANECDFGHVMWCDGSVLKAGGEYWNEVIISCGDVAGHVPK